MARLRNLLPRTRRRNERDLDRELRYHLDRRVDDLKQDGLNYDEARRQARLELGGITQVQDEVREAWDVPRFLRATGLVARDAARALRAAPAHSSFVVFILAAGITLGTLTFSVVDAVMLKPLPFERPQQLVNIQTRGPDFQPRITTEMYWRLRNELTTVERLAARITMSGVMVTLDGFTSQTSITQASAEIFPVLRLSPEIGRFWTAGDEALGNMDVAVLGYRFWQEQLDGDPSILGKAVSYSPSTASYTVIGVLSAESDHPELPDLTGVPVWIPIQLPRGPSNQVFGVTARMRPGVEPAQVAGEVQRLVGAPDWAPEVTRLLDGYVSRFRGWMLLALGAAALVLLIACANAANMMLTRSVRRTQEMAIRASLGISRRQIALGVVTEGLMLSLAAAAVALVASLASVSLVQATITSAIPGLFRASTIAIDARALAAAIGCAVVTGALFSLVPAWQTSRVQVSTLLKDSEGPTATGRRRWRSVFLTAEIATVVVLLVVSWLFVASFVQATGIDLGIDSTNLLAVSPRLEFQATVDEVRRRLEGVPGVLDVAVSRGASLPLIGSAFGGAWGTTTLERVDTGRRAGEVPFEALTYSVTPNYFAVAGLEFRAGSIWPADTPGARLVVLDEEAARQLFGAEDPIGRDVRATRPEGIYTVVGTVPHVYARGPEDPDPPSAYFPLQPDPSRTFAELLVKTSSPPEDMLPVVARALDGMGPLLEEPFVFAADDALRRITATRRFLAKLMSIFGLAGALIGAAGVYAVMASFVAQQTREIGIRMAFGATPGQVQRSVLGLAGRHLLAGLALGIPLAWWLSRGFTALLFRVTPADMSVYASIAALLCAVGCLAAWIPARCAAGVDPACSLRR